MTPTNVLLVDGKDATQQELWTVDDVAGYLRSSRSWVYKSVARGELPSLRIGGMLRFLPDQVQAAVLSAAEAGGAS